MADRGFLTLKISRTLIAELIIVRVHGHSRVVSSIGFKRHAKDRFQRVASVVQDADRAPRIDDDGELWIGTAALPGLSQAQVEKAVTFMEAHGITVERPDPVDSQAVPA